MPMVIPNSKQQQQDRKLHPRLNHAFNTDIKASQHVKRPFEQSISLGKQETITTKGNQQEIFYPEPEEKVLSSEYDLPESFEVLNQDFEGKDSLVFSTACEDIWFRFTQEKIFSSSVSSQQWFLLFLALIKLLLSLLLILIKYYEKHKLRW